jgi:predicted small lipoprotein YifL
MHARLTALLLLFAVFCLGGCGQTGPLYLPEELSEEVPEEQSEKMPAQAKPSETTEPSE